MLGSVPQPGSDELKNSVGFPVGGKTTAVIVIVAVPDLPPDIAVIDALPAAMPVMAPVDAFTVAIAVLLELHATALPVITLLLASRTVAVPDEPAPTLIDVGFSATDTEATAGAAAVVIVMVAAPLFPPDVAVIDALPAATPVTTPVEAFTVAIAVLLELQAIVRPVSTLLAESRVVAVACDVAPTFIDVGLSATDTEATDALLGAVVPVIVMLAVPLRSPVLAVIVAAPAATPVTAPVDVLTVATAVLLEVHAIGRPVTTLLFVSSAVAVA
jgi:hypothetical protein